MRNTTKLFELELARRTHALSAQQEDVAMHKTTHYTHQSNHPSLKTNVTSPIKSSNSLPRSVFFLQRVITASTFRTGGETFHRCFGFELEAN